MRKPEENYRKMMEPGDFHGDLIQRKTVGKWRFHGGFYVDLANKQMAW